MCLLAVAFQAHDEYPLVLAGNRDEFHGRPTARAHWWQQPPILAGQDLSGGGTWLGLTARGRMATITNFREPGVRHAVAPSRGELVVKALASSDPENFRTTLAASGRSYNGFNLLWGDSRQLYYAHNNPGSGPPGSHTPVHIQALEPGAHGLSNGLLDTPWPKLQHVRNGLAQMLAGADELQEEALFELLADRRQAADADLPDTGVARELEARLSSPFICGEGYGTRASTVIIIRRGGMASFRERSFDAHGQVQAEESFRFEPAPFR